MHIPVLKGVIERRILANYRVDPWFLEQWLPAPFRPKLVAGHAIAGLCLIRLAQVRPRFVPGWLGIASENAAHRIAVEWDEEGRTREGVYIRRRDTSSKLNALAGGRLFPGVHHLGRFEVHETETTFDVALDSDDGAADLRIRSRLAAGWPSGSVFRSFEDASAFFRAGSLGYSPGAEPAQLQGTELRCAEWRAEPLEVTEIHSALFDNTRLFPPGSITFDNALLMRNISHEWHNQADLAEAVAS